MDTLVSNSPVAMGPGEQQAVHPFFRKDFATSAKADPSVPNDSVTPTPANAFASCLAPSGPQNPSPEQSSQLPTSRTSEALMNQISTPLSQVEDPNASRRKRRRTEKSQHTEHGTTLKMGLSGWLGVEAPASKPPTAPPTDPEPNSPTVPPPRQSPQPQASKSIPEQGPIPADQKEPKSRPATKRKTLKLSANGRLLSSPPPTASGTATSKRAGVKRGRQRRVESKLVVIKYRAGGNGVGGLINDILSGQRVQNVAPARQAAHPPKPETQPAKPTHPFFLKKPVQTSHEDEARDAQPNNQVLSPKTAVPSTQVASSETKRDSRAFAPPSSTFIRRTTKFPELIEPLWPPRDFVHVRAVDAGQTVRPMTSQTLVNDCKKAKSPAIVVNDDENVLLASTAQARKSAKMSVDRSGHTRATLRLPGRHTASGRVLQTAIDSQMSWSLPCSRSMTNSTNPLIADLRSGLLSSVSAFDSGKYESQLWAHKYAPKQAEDVLQVGREAHILRDWLRHLKITAVDTGKSSKDSGKLQSKREKKRKKRRKQGDKLDGFIVSSEEEASEMDNLTGSDDELAGDVTVSSQKTVIRSGDLAFCSQHGEKGRITNAILLSGPSGSGKTASVYAAAKELDFEVFEINPGSRRSARDMLERVGDMTQNHLVHLLNESDDSSPRPRDHGGNDETKQNKLVNFFKGQPTQNAKLDTASAQPSPTSDTEPKRAHEQKQSLILLEEADLLFDEDKQFWTGVLALISQSRRPIVITCNDESLVPVNDMSLHAILRFQKPPRDLAIDYLLLVAANEGHVLKREAVSKLFDASGMDVRRSLMGLNFWCQMGVGSEKAGLDWILSLWPPEANMDENGDRVRVLSLNTYEPYMGWFNRDLLLEEDSSAQEFETLQNTFHWWRLGIQDSEDAAGRSEAECLPLSQFPSRSKVEQLDLLSCEADYLDMRSSLDVLCSGCPLDMLKDVVDLSPPLPESQRSNYIEAYPLLQADLRSEHSSLSETLSITFDALLSQVFRPKSEDIESTGVARIFNGWAKSAARRNTFPSSLPGFQKVFEPIMRANYSMPIPTGRLAPSFENSLAPITEDIAPYVRGIMVFDGRLKQYRDTLSAIVSKQPGNGEKRGRTTRASRAALEGGDKASTRKERWFPGDTNYFWVQGTGKPEWQDALFQMGHFHVQPAMESNEDADDHISDA